MAIFGKAKLREIFEQAEIEVSKDVLNRICDLHTDSLDGLNDILVDATLKIGGRDYEALANFFEKVAELSKNAEKDFTFTVSCDESDLPERIFTFCKKI